LHVCLVPSLWWGRICPGFFKFGKKQQHIYTHKHHIWLAKAAHAHTRADTDTHVYAHTQAHTYSNTCTRTPRTIFSC